MRDMPSSFFFRGDKNGFSGQRLWRREQQKLRGRESDFNDIISRGNSSIMEKNVFHMMFSGLNEPESHNELLGDGSKKLTAFYF